MTQNNLVLFRIVRCEMKVNKTEMLIEAYLMESEQGLKTRVGDAYRIA